jgi:hypothetical protein
MGVLFSISGSFVRAEGRRLPPAWSFPSRAAFWGIFVRTFRFTLFQLGFLFPVRRQHV